MPSERVECQCGEHFQTRSTYYGSASDTRSTDKVCVALSLPEILETPKGIQALAEESDLQQDRPARLEEEPPGPNDDEEEVEDGSEDRYGTQQQLSALTLW